MEVNPAGQIVRTWAFPVGWYVYRIETVTNLTSAATPTPSVSSPTSLDIIYTIVVSVVVVAAAAILAFVFFMKKRTSNHKVDDGKKNP